MTKCPKCDYQVCHRDDKTFCAMCNEWLPERPPLIPVVLESPFAGDEEEIKRNIRYGRACVKDCLQRGEAPYASHLLYTQEGVLDDEVPEERSLGMGAGFVWGRLAELTVVYTDLGISRGMHDGIEASKEIGRPVEYRKLGKDWDKGKES